MAPARKANVRARKALKATPATKNNTKLHVAAASKVTEAHDRYDTACKLIAKQRGTVASKGLEKEFKIWARDTYANGRVVSCTDTSREQQRVVFDELDI
jgi:hypothetical protein